MALKSSEKNLIGIALIVGGIALFFALGLPQWDEYSAKKNEIETLKIEKQNLENQKTVLGTQIKVLEKQVNTPLGFDVVTYTEPTKAKMIKAMLDHVINLSSQAGNLFIKLSSVEKTPQEIAQEQAAAQAQLASKQNPDKNNLLANLTSDDANTAEEPVVLPPSLNTFKYQLSVRGSYASIQKFLQLIDSQKALLALSDLTLENEQISLENTGDGQTVFDPTHPIKLTVNLLITMQNVSV
ncbi:MAG: hypothetical protein AAGI66_08810 [Cyanobacteria bacterium P01_H01_bin.74]